MMNKLFLPMIFLFLIFSGNFVVAQTHIWENEIIAFETKDSINMPEPGGIVFIGSSSIRGWRSLPQDFPNYPVLNRGFGGAEYKDAVYFFDRIVSKYQPKQVFLYAGDNDLASGKSPEVVFGILMQFVEKMRNQLPRAELVVISVKPSISRWEMYSEMVTVNKKIEHLAREDDQIKYVDIVTPMLGEDGKPRPELFIGDGLHMTPKGYQLWAEIIEPYLIK